MQDEGRERVGIVVERRWAACSSIFDRSCICRELSRNAADRRWNSRGQLYKARKWSNTLSAGWPWLFGVNCALSEQV